MAVLILKKVRLPVIAGLLAAGALAGPYGFHLVSHSDHLSAFAEIGVALLRRGQQRQVRTVGQGHLRTINGAEVHRLGGKLKAHHTGEAIVIGQRQRVQARAVAAVREHDRAVTAEHGDGGAWVAVSHGDVIKAVVAVAAEAGPERPQIDYGHDIEDEIGIIEGLVAGDTELAAAYPRLAGKPAGRRWLAVKLLAF